MTSTVLPVVRAGALAATVVLLASCTLSSGEEGPTSDEAAPATAEQGAADARAGGVADTVDVVLAAAGTDEVAVTDDLPVVATRAAEDADGAYEVDLNGVAVRGELMTVVFTLRVQTVAGGSFTVNNLFDDGRSVDGPGGPSYFSTDGVYVLDGAEGTRHLAAYDSGGRCVCSDALNSVAGLQEGSSVVLTTTMAAPPESTSTVDVVIPGVGAFADVALER
ncbi:hypothetical protein [Aquipuribacter sp. SD81]|uniref:hypothetical protein n=1 Tax=Aquipuribacter sp. SD81 TaxID=3127703 RepID=UPI003017E474